MFVISPLRSCTRVVLTQGFYRSCAQRRTSPYVRWKSLITPWARWCPHKWSRNAITGWTWQICGIPTSIGFLTLSPRPAFSATRLKTYSSQLHRSRQRRSNRPAAASSLPLAAVPLRLPPLPLILSSSLHPGHSVGAGCIKATQPVQTRWYAREQAALKRATPEMEGEALQEMVTALLPPLRRTRWRILCSVLFLFQILWSCFYGLWGPS